MPFKVAQSINSSKGKTSPTPFRSVGLSDDTVRKVLDYANEQLMELLAHALVSTQMNQLSRDVAARAALRVAPSARWLLTDRMAQHFAYWSTMPIRGGCDRLQATNSGIEFPEDDTLMYHCCRCKVPILRSRDIVSANYHGGWGPAFLVNQVCNVSVERNSYPATFTTGGYTVCDFSCSACRLTLGKKYVDARDPPNRFKVGKYLLEQTLVFLPGCCARVKGRRLDNGLCARCTTHFRSRTIQAMLLMTNGLAPGPTRSLYQLLSAERTALEGGQMPTEVVPKVSWWRKLRLGGSSKRVLPPLTQGQELSFGVGTRLALLCSALRGSVDAPILAVFVDDVVSSQATNSSQPATQLSRWVLAEPASAQLCKDFESARAVFAAFRGTWKNTGPNERPFAERLVGTVCEAARLDSEDKMQLLAVLGYSRPTGCTWFRCKS